MCRVGGDATVAAVLGLGSRPLFLYLYILWLVGVEHFQGLVEIIDDGLVLRIGALNNDTHVVVCVLVADATEKDGELFDMVVLLKPTLEEQTALFMSLMCYPMATDVP